MRMVSNHPKRTLGLLIMTAAVLVSFFWGGGWIAAAAGIGLIGGLVGVRTHKQVRRRLPWRRRCGTGSGRAARPARSSPTGTPAADPAALQHRRLEAILAKARRQAFELQDTYGAKNTCLEVIRRTGKDDPLFVKACDLYLRIAASRPPHARKQRKSEALSPPPPSDRQAPAAGPNVIPFPRSAGRR